MPIDFELYQNYPNPFNAITNIRFSLQNRNIVKVKVYDTIGREVVTLLDEVKNPGIHEINFDGKGLTSGVYFYKMQVGNSARVRKLILIK